MNTILKITWFSLIYQLILNDKFNAKEVSRK